MTPIRSIFALGCVSALLCACTNSGGYFQNDGPPSSMWGERDFSNAPNAVVRIEQPHKAANRPYTINGVKYRPMTGDAPLNQTGIASWYGKQFHGKKTSIGERYDMFAMTAAHTTMELPSYAKVTNLENGKTVIVRVNDRGPFLHNRVIDLSYAAASKLGYVNKGTDKVKVERIRRADIKSGRFVTPGNIQQVEPVNHSSENDADLIMDSLQHSLDVIVEEREAIVDSRKKLEAELEAQKAELQAKIDEHNAKVAAEAKAKAEAEEKARLDAERRAKEAEERAKEKKPIIPPFTKFVEYAVSVYNGRDDVELSINDKQTLYKFVCSGTPFIVLQKTNNDYRIGFLAKTEEMRELLYKFNGIVTFDKTVEYEKAKYSIQSLKAVYKGDDSITFEDIQGLLTNSLQVLLEAEELEAAITPKTKILIMPFPNNPTGAIMTKEDLEPIVEVVKKHDLYVISDEIYSELTYGSKHVSIASFEGMKERTILINGFSKAFAMTGWRLGYACGPKEIIEQMIKIHQYAIMCAPTNSQYAAVEALRNCDEEVQEMVANNQISMGHARVLSKLEDDNKIIETVYFGLSPNDFADPEYDTGAYNVDDNSDDSLKYIFKPNPEYEYKLIIQIKRRVIICLIIKDLKY